VLQGDSEADSDAGMQKLENLDTTDCARGRRLKKLHTLLHTRMARIDFMHFKEQMVWILALLLAVHLALFVVSKHIGRGHGFAEDCCMLLHGLRWPHPP